MKKYEAIIITRQDIQTTYPDTLKEKISAYLRRDGGEINEFQDMGKKKLAYNIKGQGKGNFFQLAFSSSGATNLEIQKYLQIDENILRYQINKL